MSEDDFTIDFVPPEEIDDFEADCLVIGGVADGVLMRVKYGAERIMLGRPTHAKPLESPYQKDFEMAKETDEYVISRLHMPTSSNQLYPFLLAIVADQSPAWAAKQLAVAYVKYSTMRMVQQQKETLQ